MAIESSSPGAVLVLGGPAGLPGPRGADSTVPGPVGGTGPQGPPGPPGASSASLQRASVNDANYTIPATNTYVGMTALTANRTLTLPSALSYPPAQTLYVADESGACSSALLITVAAAGSDKIAGQTSVAMGSPYQKLAFHSNGSNLWTFA